MKINLQQTGAIVEEERTLHISHIKYVMSLNLFVFLNLGLDKILIKMDFSPAVLSLVFIKKFDHFYLCYIDNSYP